MYIYMYIVDTCIYTCDLSIHFEGSTLFIVSHSLHHPSSLLTCPSPLPSPPSPLPSPPSLLPPLPGPLPQTVVDFWRAVWQEKVGSIVMVTNVMEGNHVKCHRYWPETGTVNYGPFSVTLAEKQMFADYIIHHLHIVVSMKRVSCRIHVLVLVYKL